ncbi:putative hydrolase [Halobacteriovorax marinus SJ]|uniref:Hydrolase n=1 Tax=Halobacteriovorax marinus (strain ATCC BAA-682 / DSM 15412 / SJ) TaxID=862908 RepID=E1X0R7_HALMS|nr:alpha/beta hydrolase [Halobacteriovorax marinus]CBW26405.1 putative hydrolase [Halobacteriovorax marinus SJ]
MYCVDSRFRNGLEIFFINEVKDFDRDIIVMLHGFPDDAFSFEGQIESLKERFNIIAPFMHGVLNDSELNKNRICPRELIHDILHLLKEVNPNGEKRVYLMGHDLGCFLSTAIAQISSHQIKGIVHINGLGLQQFYSRKYNLNQWIKSYYVLLTQVNIFRFFVTKVFPDFFLNLIYKLSYIEKDHDLYQRDRRVFNSIYIYKYLFRKTFSLIGAPTMKVSVPTLFLWGNRDNFLEIPSLVEVEKFYDKAQVRVLPGGHWVHLSAQDKVNRILENWSGFCHE